MARRIRLERQIADGEQRIAERHPLYAVQIRPPRASDSELDRDIQTLRRRLLAAYAAYKVSVRETSTTSRNDDGNTQIEAVVSRRYEAMAALVQARAAYRHAVSQRIDPG